MRFWVLWLALSTFVLALTGRARAEFPSVNARRFQPPVDPSGSLYLEPALTPGPGVWSGAAWFLYSYRPDVLRDANGSIVGNLVTHQLSADLVTGIGLGQRFAIGLDLPVLLYQQGEDNAATRAVQGGTPTAQALGDVALSAKGNLVSYGSLGGFGLSALLRMTAPSGNSGSYLGEGTPTGELRLLGEFRLIAVALQATAGFKLRFEETDVLGQTYTHEVPWGLGIAVRPQAFGWDDKGRFTWVAEVHGSALLPPSQGARDRGQTAPTSPVLGGLSAQFAPSDVSFRLGAETGLTQAFGSPPFQIAASVQWSPRAHDMDHDGVPDDVDQCPELPEDRDGVQDADGCPDYDEPQGESDDTDKDGVPDQQDACPNEPGEKSADPKSNGCPDRDKDGIADQFDKCPNEPEDKDGFQDADGCPDPDNDKDGVADAQDQCPNTPAGPLADPKRPGCPAPDRDGDTMEDAADKCPDQPETFNGVEDEDGCPDQGGKPLVVITEKGADITAAFAAAVKFKGSKEAPEIDAASLPILRALALELNRHPQWVVAVGVRPAKAGAFEQQGALAQSFAVVDTLRKFTYRDGVAETVGWRAVAKQPGAAKNGFGVLVLTPPAGAGAPPNNKIETTPATGDTPKK